jgi:glycosyltransferase involved in cell wall biosynthesis
MKIILISPYPPLKDGLARYTQQLVSELKHRKVSVGVISSDYANPNEGVGAAITLSLRKLLQAYQYIRKERPDIVHVQYVIPAFGLASFPMWALLLLAKKRLHCKLVITFHEVKRETALLGPAGALYMRATALLADYITVHTHEAARLLAEHCGVPAAKITRITHPLYIYPLDKGNTTALRARHHLQHQVVLFFGFIHVDKGIDHLIRAFALARSADQRLQDARLIIAGSVRKREGLFKLFEKKDVAYEAKLHQLVQDLRIPDQVTFVPYVPDKEVGSWFSTADVVVLPYTNLEQSGVLNVALGSQTPMIVSDLGGLGETMAGTNALVPPADDEALAHKLQQFLTDPTQAKKLTANYGRIRNEQALATIVTQLQGVYAAAYKDLHG